MLQCLIWSPRPQCFIIRKVLSPQRSYHYVFSCFPTISTWYRNSTRKGILQFNDRFLAGNLTPQTELKCTKINQQTISSSLLTSEVLFHVVSSFETEMKLKERQWRLICCKTASTFKTRIYFLFRTDFCIIN